MRTLWDLLTAPIRAGWDFYRWLTTAGRRHDD